MEENIIKRKMEEKIESFGFSKNDLTQEEWSELEDEIKAELDGAIILDGVLTSIPPYRVQQKER